MIKKRENFTNESEDTLMMSVMKDREMDNLKNQVSNIENDIKDLTDVIRLKTINMANEKNSEAADFDLLASQKKQDQELQSIENELDVLLKLYRKETELNDSNKYHSLPVFSSCKNQEEGLRYLREDNEGTSYDNYLSEVQVAENQELMKNLGIDSKSSAELMTLMKKGNFNDNVDFHINLV